MGEKTEKIKIFIQYLIVGGLIESNIENLKRLIKWVKKPMNQSYICLGFTLYFTLIHKYNITFWLLILFTLLHLRAQYLTGEFIHWDRKRKGILSSKQKLRQESKLEETENESGIGKENRRIDN